MVIVEGLDMLEEVAPFARLLDRDLLHAATGMSRNEMRYLVHAYYRIQKHRIALGNACAAHERAGEPAQFARWLAEKLQALEKALRRIMGTWAEEYEAGRWALAQYGVGPVIAAGLLAHLDPERCRTAGSVWRFAGLDPTVEWKPGERRPYNAALKVLAFKAGDSFVKFHKRPDCFYGQLYARRKALEVARNESGYYAETARKILAERQIRDPELRATLEAGRLAPGHIEMRARRWTVKLFLAHFATVYYETETGQPAPQPYPVAHLGHAEYIAPPGYTPLALRDGRA